MRNDPLEGVIVRPARLKIERILRLSAFPLLGLCHAGPQCLGNDDVSTHLRARAVTVQARDVAVRVEVRKRDLARATGPCRNAACAS